MSTSFSDLIQIAFNVFRRRIKAVDGGLDVELVKVLLDLQSTVNVNNLLNKESIALVWRMIDNDAKVSSVFLDATAEIRFRGQLSTLEWKTLVDQMVHSVGGTLDGDRTIGPLAYHQRTETVDARQSYLKGNDWLFSVIFLCFSEPILSPEEIRQFTPDEVGPNGNAG